MGAPTRHRPVEDPDLTSMGAKAPCGAFDDRYLGGPRQVMMAVSEDKGTKGPRCEQLTHRPCHPSQTVRQHPARGSGPSTRVTSPGTIPNSNPPAPSNVGTPTISSEALAIKLQAEGLKGLT